MFVASDRVLGLPIPTFATAVQLTLAATLYHAALMPLALIAVRRATAGLHWEPAAP